MTLNRIRPWAVLITTLFTLAANIAANALPLNGRTTGEISDSFNVLFVPAGYVFSIWGLIYMGLIAYTFYQLLPAQRNNPALAGTGWLVTLSNLANGGWIFFWHYGQYPLTLALMLILLATLITIYLRLQRQARPFSPADRWLARVPFSIYLGWITVATIANVTALLGSLGYTGAPIGGVAWTVLLLVVAVGIAGLMAVRFRDAAYLLVLVWAFIGISIRWLDLPVINAAGFAAAGAVLLFILLTRFRRTPAPASPSRAPSGSLS